MKGQGRKEATTYTPEVLERAVRILELSSEPMNPTKLARAALSKDVTKNCADAFMKALGTHSVQVWQDDIQVGNRPRQLVGLTYKHGLEEV